MKGDDPESVHRALLQEIGEVFAAEKGSISLTKLPDDFYQRASSYLRSSLARIENLKAKGEDSIQGEYYRLTGEYRRSKDILNSIYNTRERKIVLMAMNSARRISQSTDNMEHDEMDLFFSLKLELEKFRERILKFSTRGEGPLRPQTGIDTPLQDYIESESAPLSPFGGKAPIHEQETGTEEPAVEEAVKSETAPAPAADEHDDIPEGMMLVRALKDIDRFMCPDNTSMSMKKEDVALLDREVAEILMGGDLVEPMGGSR